MRKLWIICALALGLLLPSTVLAKVYILWTEKTMPPAKLLGVDDLVVPWSDDAQTVAATAKKQGYRVYFQASLPDSESAARAASSSTIAGIILKGEAAEESQLQTTAATLRSKYPKLSVSVLSARGKQPQMRGWLVFKRDGILQASSPSSQPWLDQNLAAVRYERTFAPGQAPLYTFSWDDSDPILKERGPTPDDYSLAVAEAGAFRADLLLELYDHQEKELRSADKNALAAWESVKRTIAFYAKSSGAKEPATVAVLADNYETSYESINLMARHNIPFRVLKSANVGKEDLPGFNVIVAFAAPTTELVDGIRAFAEQGGTAVLVNLHATYAWDSDTAAKKSDHSVTYTLGKGRVIELDQPVTDPETFAQDIRRLMANDQVPISLWNSLTTLIAEYTNDKSGATTVELLNYSEEPTQVQVQVRGSFTSLRYETPETGCCTELHPSHVGGFTEFVVPNLLTGGRVHLGAVATSSSK
jgi:hypothetical protein